MHFAIVYHFVCLALKLGAHVGFWFFFYKCACFDKHGARKTFTMEIREKRIEKNCIFIVILKLLRRAMQCVFYSVLSSLPFSVSQLFCFRFRFRFLFGVYLNETFFHSLITICRCWCSSSNANVIRSKQVDTTFSCI